MIKIKKIDLTGERFGKLTVIEKGSGYISPSGSKSTTWICKCDCGNTTVVRASSLKSGDTKSCGCLSKSVHSKVAFKHGFGNEDRIYRIWTGIKTRCFNNNMKYWKHYGGKDAGEGRGHETEKESAGAVGEDEKINGLKI